MKKVFITLIAAVITCSLSPAFAADTKPEQKKAAKQSTKQNKKQAKKTEGKEPEIAGAAATEFKCSQGKKVTIYNNPQNEQQHMRWDKKLLPMTNVETESGAVRLENKEANLTWISVPEKSMLLDAKKGLRLATDCLRPDQG